MPLQVMDAAWAKMTALASSEALSWQHPLKERLRLNTVMFLVACIYSGTAAFSSRLSGRVKIAATACCIHALACLSYTVMYLDLVPLVATFNTGRTMVVTRVFEWSVTVPLLLSLIGRLIDSDSDRVKQLYVRQLVCILIGGFGPLLAAPYNWLCYTYSCYLQLLVLVTLNGYLAAAKRKLRSRHDLLLIHFLRFSILTLFTVYPIVWALTVELDWLPLPQEMWLFANMDITTKLILTSVLSNLTAAAYDYDYVDLPRYFKDLISVMGVPAFAINKEGNIAHWNRAMEAITNRSGAEVLWEHFDKCDVFTPSSVKILREAVLSNTAAHNISSIGTEVPTVELETTVRGQPQESSISTVFYVLRGTESEGGSAPRAVFIEASNRSSATHSAIADLARQLFNKEAAVAAKKSKDM